jgi:hypothetical protein
MRLFGIPEAAYYCTSFASTSGDAELSLDMFQKNRLSGRRVSLVEGTSIYGAYRDCSLRESERSLFFAASCYRRSVDMMICSSAPWALVTIYYGCWYAARALLGIFGCTIFADMVVDVVKGSPGGQELRVRKIGNGLDRQPTTYRGSHRQFWDLFYQAVTSLRPLVQANLVAALSPIAGDPIWLIQSRNEINYDSWHGLRLSLDFERTFSEAVFPNCLPGPLGTQFAILELLLDISYSYAMQLGLRTDALDSVGKTRTLRDKVAELVYDVTVPDLVGKTKRSIVA